MTHSERGRPLVVVMGVSGSGKSTVAQRLADRLGVPFAEGDDLHPVDNVAKMAAGTPLDDTDRAVWLDRLAEWLETHACSGGVVSASVLRRGYRDRLRARAPRTVLLHLAGKEPMLRRRLEARRGHFMPPELLDSQLATLEPLGPDEAGLTVEAEAPPDVTIDRFLRWSS